MQSRFKLSPIALAVLSCSLLPELVVAEESQDGFEVIEVTATRRSGTVQEAPLNITALADDVMKNQNIGELADVARWVPGLTIADQGGRTGSPIIVRGLNTNSSGPQSDGGTVATYLGEIPLTTDMRLIDVERVEVLIGPQGTLYGAGTLAGAIRYIPKQVELDYTSGEVFGDLFSLSESDSLGSETGFVFNTPIIDDVFGVRASVNYFNDPGFIDYNYLVRTPGVSRPDPDWNNSDEVSENITRQKDANGEQTLTARVALRYVPTDWLDATLTYFHQKRDTEGRSIVHFGTLADNNPLQPLVAPYESAYRYQEPYDNEDSLLSLEIKADLGFAELVSATGISEIEGEGQRDQTDLLVRLDYGYEDFPAFTAFTREIDNEDNFTQELRLVSSADSDFSWIAGAYYNKQEVDGLSLEFTPSYPEFIGVNRPDNLEYYSLEQTTAREKALFGEVSYAISEQLDITVGGRFYDFDIQSLTFTEFPLVNPDFQASNISRSDLSEAREDGSGSLFKFNVSYQFTPDVLTYFTASEGFRLGGSNGLAPCNDTGSQQSVCAQPDELLFDADTTTNYELGFKSTWLSNHFHFNAALFYVDWQDPQLDTASLVGQQPITKNAGSAVSKGLEIASRAIISEQISAYATYAYAKAELTSDVPGLFARPGEAGTALQDFYDGKDGDRLPGAPEHQFSFGANYNTEVFGDKLLDINYGLTYQSDLVTKVGLRADGETLPGYALSNLSAKISGDAWSVTLYVDNLFDKYAVTSARRDRGDVGQARFPSQNSNGADIQRNYGYYVVRPRTAGIKFDYIFES